jgi:hypothetical protein
LRGPEAVIVQSLLIRKIQESEGNLLEVSRKDEEEILLRATDMFRNNVMGMRIVWCWIGRVRIIRGLGR